MYLSESLYWQLFGERKIRLFMLQLVKILCPSLCLNTDEIVPRSVSVLHYKYCFIHIEIRLDQMAFPTLLSQIVMASEAINITM